MLSGVLQHLKILAFNHGVGQQQLFTQLLSSASLFLKRLALLLDSCSVAGFQLECVCWFEVGVTAALDLCDQEYEQTSYLGSMWSTLCTQLNHV